MKPLLSEVVDLWDTSCRGGIQEDRQILRGVYATHCNHLRFCMIATRHGVVVHLTCAVPAPRRCQLPREQTTHVPDTLTNLIATGCPFKVFTPMCRSCSVNSYKLHPWRGFPRNDPPTFKHHAEAALPYLLPHCKTKIQEISETCPSCDANKSMCLPE